MEQLMVSVGYPILVALGAAIGVALLAILVKLLKRYGIELSEAQQAQLKQIIQGLILQIEEWARRRALEGRPVTSADKDAKFKQLAEATPELVKLPLVDVLAQRDEELPKVRAALEPVQVKP